MVNPQFWFLIYTLATVLFLYFFFEKDITKAVIIVVIIIITAFIQKNEMDSKFTEIRRIDITTYIQCISGVEYIVTSKSLTVSLDQNGKPKSCINRIYTYEQVKSAENESRIFMKIY